MEINGKFRCGMTGSFGSKRVDGATVHIVTVKLKTRRDRASTGKIFGDELADVAFSLMRERGGGEGDPRSRMASFAYKKMVPSLACAYHVFRIDDVESLRGQPVVKMIEAIDGTEEVTITVAVQILIGSDSVLAGKLATKFGSQVDAEFAAEQLELPDTERPTTGNHAFGNPPPVAFGN